jgi:hypothetical protein
MRLISREQGLGTREMLGGSRCLTRVALISVAGLSGGILDAARSQFNCGIRLESGIRGAFCKVSGGLSVPCFLFPIHFSQL